MTSDTTRTKIVVIGAGQAGLSVAYYLKRFGYEPGDDLLILDRNPSTGGAWGQRWAALKIGSAHRINDLPGMDELGLSFESADRKAPAKDVVADFYRRYEEHYDLQVLRPVTVTSVFSRGTDLVVGWSRDDAFGEIITDVVVNATGTWGSPFVPWYPGRDTFRGRHVHTADYVSADEFEGQSVIVVGGGTSAIGFVMELDGVARETTWVTRRPVEFREQGELNLEDARDAVAKQDEAARAGRALPSIVSGTGVPRTRRIQSAIDRGVLTERRMFETVEPDGVRFEDGSFQQADAIIWATGFRPELRHLAPLRLREKAGGVQVGDGASWKDPRIFFAGYGPMASTIGANRAGRQVARHVVSTLTNLGY